VDSKQIRAEIAQTRASIDRKLDLLSERTADATQAARGVARKTAAATLVSAGAAIAMSWLRRRG
jgi:hypothetical protein